MIFSLNNRLVLEPYSKVGLKSEVKNGIATPGQRDSVHGLKVLMDTTLSDGKKIPKGSTAYIKEEALHTSQWASKPLKCPSIAGSFLIVDLNMIEFIDTNGDST